MSQPLELEEYRFIAGFQQQVQNARDKAWHDRHIKHKVFQVGDLVLLYDRNFLKHPSKFQTHWLGPFVITQVTATGAIQWEKLHGEPHGSLFNGSRLKLYKDNPIHFSSTT